jgi:hypothetical protein
MSARAAGEFGRVEAYFGFSLYIPLYREKGRKVSQPTRSLPLATTTTALGTA